MSESHRVGGEHDGCGTCEHREEGELDQYRECGATAWCDMSQNTGVEDDNNDWSISGARSAKRWRPARSQEPGWRR